MEKQLFSQNFLRAPTKNLQQAELDIETLKYAQFTERPLLMQLILIFMSFPKPSTLQHLLAIKIDDGSSVRTVQGDFPLNTKATPYPLNVV